MVSIEHKVHVLLVQWIKSYVVSPNSWVSLLTFWCFDRFGVDPFDILSSPFLFYPRRLSPFYASLLLAWRAIGGSAKPLVCSPSVAFPDRKSGVYGVLLVFLH